MVWDLDEWVTAKQYAEPHVREMEAFDRLPRHVKAELRRTGQSALAYLEYVRGLERVWQHIDFGF